MTTATSLHAAGIIEQTSDADVFSFQWPGGLSHVEADSNPDAPMLDLTLGLFDHSGNLLASSLSSLLGEQIDLPLAADSYYVSVTSAGGYGDIGQYTLSVTVPEPTAGAAGVMLIALLCPRRRAVFMSDRAVRSPIIPVEV